MYNRGRYGSSNSAQVAMQTEVTYKDYKKIKGFEDVGYFLDYYVERGGEVAKNITRNDMVDVADIVAVLDDDVTSRPGASFQAKYQNATYYVDFYEGDFWWSTAHPVGVAGKDYLTLAVVTTDGNRNIDIITDARGTVGGFRLKDGIDMRIPYYDEQLADVTEDIHQREVNVKSAPFNAKGDGVTVDTVAIQSAIDTMHALGGGVVKVPLGRYKSGTISIKDNVLLEGIGPSSIIDLIDDGTPTSIFVDMQDCSNVGLRDLMIEQSNATGRTSVYGLVTANNANNVTIHGVHFGKASSTAIWTANCTNWSIIGCVVRDTYADGFHLSRGSRRFRIIGNDFANTGDDAIGVIGYIDDDQYPMCEDFVLMGNTVYNSQQRGFGLNGVSGVVVVGNTIHRTQKSGINVGSYENIHNNLAITITGNIIKDTGISGPGGDTSGIYFGYCRGALIANNVIDTSTGDGITIFPVVIDLDISHNHIYRCKLGIFSDQLHISGADYPLAIKELLTDFGDLSTSLGVQRLRITGNTCAFHRVDGMYIDGESSYYTQDVIISENNCYSNNWDNAVDARNIFLAYANNVILGRNIGGDGKFPISQNIAYTSCTNLEQTKLVQSGASSTDGTDTKFTTKDITFEKKFETTPAVIVGGDVGSDDYRWRAKDITTTGFQAVGIKDDGDDASTGIWFNWLASGT